MDVVCASIKNNGTFNLDTVWAPLPNNDIAYLNTVWNNHDNGAKHLDTVCESPFENKDTAYHTVCGPIERMVTLIWI